MTLQVAFNNQIISNSVVFEYKARALPTLPSSQHDWLSLDGKNGIQVTWPGPDIPSAQEKKPSTQRGEGKVISVSGSTKEGWAGLHSQAASVYVAWQLCFWPWASHILNLVSL